MVLQIIYCNDCLLYPSLPRRHRSNQVNPQFCKRPGGKYGVKFVRRRFDDRNGVLAFVTFLHVFKRVLSNCGLEVPEVGLVVSSAH